MRLPPGVSIRKDACPSHVRVPATAAERNENVRCAVSYAARYPFPSALRRFWERFELSGIRARGWRMPDLLDPRTALETHRANLDPAFALMFGPPLFFPLARISGDQWSIELASAEDAGGMIVSHDVPGPMVLEYPTFVDLLEVYGELLEEGGFERFTEGYLVLGRDDERAKQDARIAAAWPHPVYGDARRFSSNPAEWPAHWIAAAG